MLSSHASRSTNSQPSVLIDANILTDKELKQIADDLKEKVTILNIENDVLERTIKRLDPALLTGVYTALKLATNARSASSITLSGVSQTMSRIRPSKMSVVSNLKLESSGKIRSVVSGGGPKINLYEMSEIITTEMHVLDNYIKKEHERAIKKHALYKAYFEEIEKRIQHIEIEKANFTDVVVVKGYNRITKRIPAETWVRFMSESVKTSEKQIEKMRLRTFSLSAQYNKLKQVVKTKAELSDKITPVDFDKLEIENGECVNVIEQKLKNLDDLKQWAGDLHLMLAIHRDALAYEELYLSKVEAFTKRRWQEVGALNKERDRIKVEVDTLVPKLEKIREIRNAYAFIDVMDYLNVKSVIDDLQKHIKVLERKVCIKQTALVSAIKEKRKKQKIKENLWRSTV